MRPISTALRRQRQLAIAGLIALPVVLTSCASAVQHDAGGHQKTSRQATKSILASNAAATARQVLENGGQEDFSDIPNLPVAAIEISPQRQAVLTDALAVSETNCMATLGVRYSGALVGASAAEDPMQRRYGVSDLTTAKTLGYHLPGKGTGASNVASSQPTVPTAKTNALLAGAVTSAPNGAKVPAGGCTAAAERDVKQTPSSSSNALQANGLALGVISRIDAESYVATLHTAKVQDLFSSWSKCMLSKGYHYSSPLAALDAANLRTPAASSAEIRTATSDVTCKISTGLVQKWSALESPLQTKAIAAAQPDIKAYVARLNTQLRAAASTLGMETIPR